MVTRAGFLDFLTPAAGTKPSKRGRAQEIVDELLDLSEDTEAGIKVSPSVRQEIEELVDELESFCPKQPLRSELIFGEWEVVFASKPQTAGGPFRSPVGRAVFPGQRAIQIIEAPNVCINEVSYKTLGFIPGTARQEGEIEPIDEETFQITFAAGGVPKGAGGPPQRVIKVAYLDERVRVARAVPQEEGQEGSFYIFKRVETEEDEEEEEDEPTPAPPARAQRQRQQRREVVEEEPAPQPVSRSPFGTQIFSNIGKKGGMATQAERAYQNKGGRAAPPPAPPAQKARGRSTTGGTGTQVRKSPQEAAAERAAARAAAEEERRLERERAAAAKAAAEEERRLAREAAEEERRRAREAAEAERAALAQRRAAAKEQYDQLAAEAAEASTAARDAVTAAKSAEREAAGLLRQAGQARGIIERAVAAAEAAAARLQDGMAEEVAAEKEVLERQRVVNQLEKQLRQKAAELAPKLAKK